jgi:hypothetical protein
VDIEHIDLSVIVQPHLGCRQLDEVGERLEEMVKGRLV